MLVKVKNFIFPTDFVILDFDVDFKVPVIVGWLFFAISREPVDMESGELKFRLNNDNVKFNVCQSMKNQEILVLYLWLM